MGQFFTRRRLALLLVLLILSAPFIAMYIEQFIADANRANLPEELLQATVDAQLTSIAESSVTPTLDVDQRVEATLTAVAPAPDEPLDASSDEATGIGALIGNIIGGVLGFIWGIITGIVGVIAGILGGFLGGVNAVTMCCSWGIFIGIIILIVSKFNGGW